MVTAPSRVVRVGGVDKPGLLSALARGGFGLNEAGRALFAHDAFTTADGPSILETVEFTVADLGFADGAVMAQIVDRALQRGLSPCPLELGPHLRLQYLDQPEGHAGHPRSRHRAPPGSLTIVSRPVAEDDEVPKGFYLRRIDGVLWLRGYRSGPDHVWSPGDHLLFATSPP